MGKFIKLVDQLKKDIEVLSDTYEKLNFTFFMG